VLNLTEHIWVGRREEGSVYLIGLGLDRGSMNWMLDIILTSRSRNIRKLQKHTNINVTTR
jgi:hypothetical protein